MKCNLNQWVFFFIRFTYPCQGLYCRKFTASNGYSALYNIFFSIQFLQCFFFKIKDFQGTSF